MEIGQMSRNGSVAETPKSLEIAESLPSQSYRTRAARHHKVRGRHAALLLLSRALDLIYDAVLVRVPAYLHARV